MGTYVEIQRWVTLPRLGTTGYTGHPPKHSKIQPKRGVFCCTARAQRECIASAFDGARKYLIILRPPMYLAVIGLWSRCPTRLFCVRPARWTNLQKAGCFLPTSPLSPSPFPFYFCSLPSSVCQLLFMPSLSFPADNPDSSLSVNVRHLYCVLRRPWRKRQRSSGRRRRGRAKT